MSRRSHIFVNKPFFEEFPFNLHSFMRRFGFALGDKMMKMIDIGANLTDPMYQGIYNGNAKHGPDLSHVLNRGWSGGLDKIIITVGTLSDCGSAFDIVKNDERLYCTVGVHPTYCGQCEADPDAYFASLCHEIESHRDKVIAVGECGLDYDRLHFCEKNVQQRFFEKQLDLAEKYSLPLFLHCRNAHDDLIAILQRNLQRLPKRGVVHSFDGPLVAAETLIAAGFYIGLNGCSLKTEDNLAVAASIPDEWIMIETDSPWCEIRPSHAGSKYVKSKFPTVKKKEKWDPNSLIAGRCEPVMICQVLEVLAGVKKQSISELAAQYYNNTMKMFFSVQDTP